MAKSLEMLEVPIRAMYKSSVSHNQRLFPSAHAVGDGMGILEIGAKHGSPAPVPVQRQAQAVTGGPCGAGSPCGPWMLPCSLFSKHDTASEKKIFVTSP